jgi:hypothetical protein
MLAIVKKKDIFMIDEFYSVGKLICELWLENRGVHGISLLFASH